MESWGCWSDEQTDDERDDLGEAYEEDRNAQLFGEVFLMVGQRVLRTVRDQAQGQCYDHRLPDFVRRHRCHQGTEANTEGQLGAPRLSRGEADRAVEVLVAVAQVFGCGQPLFAAECRRDVLTDDVVRRRIEHLLRPDDSHEDLLPALGTVDVHAPALNAGEHFCFTGSLEFCDEIFVELMIQELVERRSCTEAAVPELGFVGPERLVAVGSCGCTEIGIFGQHIELGCFVGCDGSLGVHDFVDTVLSWLERVGDGPSVIVFSEHY